MVFATSTDDVVAVVKACAAHRVPLIPFGAGTSLEGHVAALHGGICLDVSQMDRVLAVNVEDLDCVVQPGVHRIALNQRLGREGLFFPIDPGADASIGGMAATRASGTNAVRYGTMRDNVLALEAVLADGSVIRTGSRARKSSAGYDLTRLLVGSEGTLGVITEVTLRLHGRARGRSAAPSARSPTVDGAVQTVIETIQLGVPVARIELLDAVQVAACNRYSDLDLPEQPLLLLEFHGSRRPGSRSRPRTVREIAEGNGGTGWAWSSEPEQRTRLWKARHDAYYAALALRPGARGVPTDVCVPISRLADAIVADPGRHRRRPACSRRSSATSATATSTSSCVFDPDDADERRARAGAARAPRRARARDGRHLHRRARHRPRQARRSCEQEHGPAVAAMRAVKQALDPLNILNPGKLVPAG